MSSTAQIDQLLAEHRAAGPRLDGATRLVFEGVGERDVYNVSVPFEAPGLPGSRVLAGRVETRDSEQSTVVFFTEEEGVWQPVPGAARLDLQDPFVFAVRGTRYLGGVEIQVPDVGDLVGEIRYRTIVLRCDDLTELVPVFDGPWGMKDLRFGELPDGRVAVVTRPQGGADGRGRIGVTVVDAVESLTVADIERAPRLEGLFLPEEWGGVNQVDVLDDGRLDVLAHIARFDDQGGRHYYPITFEIDPVALSWTAPQMLFERGDLPDGESKRPDLRDVVFPGGRERRDGRTSVICGVGDAETWWVSLVD